MKAFARLLFSNPLSALGEPRFDLARPGRIQSHDRRTGRTRRDLPALSRRHCSICCAQEKARGRSIHLVTAADQKTADAVAAYLGLFDLAAGSDGKRNLKGSQKLDYLRERFADGFIYAGDHAADLPLFKAARGAILCDVNRRVATSARAGATILADLQQPPRT